MNSGLPKPNDPDRRHLQRHPVRLDVDLQTGDAFLYSRTSNLSELGVFVVSATPSAPGTRVHLRFGTPGDGGPLEIEGEVRWIDRGGGGREPGMGIRFVEPTVEVRAQIKALIRTIAYLE
jgi:uncharacterized protein (TIGR02266 family)